MVKYKTAGMVAYPMIWKYGTSMSSLMIKAPAPMTGGIICPPLLAAASAAPAMCGLSPIRFIKRNCERTGGNDVAGCAAQTPYP